MRINKWWGTGVLVAGLSCGAAEVIRVDTSDVIRTIERNPLGINLNYLRDDDANRPGAPRLSTVLKDLGVKWLRYPGGEKSDHYRFAVPPYDRAAPAVNPARDGLYTKAMVGYDLLDFDEFVAEAREIGAEPVVVVAYDSMSNSGTSLEEFVEHAAAWVRYANVVKKYNIRYWEIGNENWHNDSKNPIEQRSRDVLKIAKAMHAVDPAIKLGSSGIDGKILGQELDFFTYSNYAGMPIDKYRMAVNPSFCKFKKDIPQQKDVNWANKEVFAVEFNAVEFVQPQDWNHDVTHCIELFDMMGQLLSNPRLDCAMIWGTRWMEEDHSAYIWYTVDNKNRLTPIGNIYAMWSKNLKPNMVRASGPAQTRCFAMHDPQTGELSVMVVNQSENEQTVQIKTSAKFTSARQQVFEGKAVNDNWGTLSEKTVDSDTDTVFVLPATSASAITFVGNKKDVL